MQCKIQIRTDKHNGLYDITQEFMEIVDGSNVKTFILC